MRPETEEVRVSAMVDELLAERIRRLIELYPTYGYRLLWAMLRKEGVRVNRKAVYRVLRLKRWLVHQRRMTPRPRVQGRRSQAEKSNARWAMDVTHIPCGEDGWGHLAAIIDCHDRELIGFEFALRGRAKEAERALEEACIARFGTLVRTAKRLSCEATMDSSFRAAAFEAHAATTAFRRNSSRPTPRNKTDD